MEKTGQNTSPRCDGPDEYLPEALKRRVSEAQYVSCSCTCTPQTVQTTDEGRAGAAPPFALAASCTSCHPWTVLWARWAD